MKKQQIFGIRFKYEFNGAGRHLRKFRAAYFAGAASFIIFVSVVTWFRKDAATSDIPMIVLASCILAISAGYFALSRVENSCSFILGKL